MSSVLLSLWKWLNVWIYTVMVKKTVLLGIAATIRSSLSKMTTPNLSSPDASFTLFSLNSQVKQADINSLVFMVLNLSHQQLCWNFLSTLICCYWRTIHWGSAALLPRSLVYTAVLSPCFMDFSFSSVYSHLFMNML